MAARTCGTCGATVAVLADLCPQCGADPDLQLQDLSIGPSRPEAAVRRGGGRGWRSWAPLVLVVALVGGALALAGSDGGTGAPEAAAASTTTSTSEPTTTTRRPVSPIVTTTTAFVPTGPVLGEPVGQLLVLGGDTTSVFDLDTGERFDVAQRGTVLGGLDGRLLVAREDRVEWWPRPFDGEVAEPAGDVANVAQAWIDPVTEAVWLTSFEDGGGPSLHVLGPGGTSTAVSIPGASWPVGTVDGGIVVNAPGGTYVVDGRGAAGRISDAAAFAAGGDRVLATACDERLACEVVLLDRDGGVLTQLADVDLQRFGMVAISSRGALAALDFETGTLTVDGAARGDLEGVGVQSMTWSSDGRRLFAVLPRSVLVLDVDTGQTLEPDLGRLSTAYQVWVVDHA